MPVDMNRVRFGAKVALGAALVIFLMTTPLGTPVGWVLGQAFMLGLMTVIAWVAFVCIGYVFVKDADPLLGLCLVATLLLAAVAWHNVGLSAGVMYILSGCIATPLSYRHHKQRIDDFVGEYRRLPTLRDYAFSPDEPTSQS